MKIASIGAVTLAIAGALAASPARPAHAAAAAPPAAKEGAPAAERPVLGPPIYKLDDKTMLRWPLPAGQEKYGKIDGFKLKPHVDKLIDIAEKYRDSGHQWWGRITTTPAFDQTQAYIESEFKKYGLQTRRQAFELPPIWFPDSWQVTASAGGQTFNIKTAQPSLRSPGTADQGLNAEAVYVGLGSVAETKNVNLKGKVAVVYTIPEPSALRHSASVEGTMKRIQDSGAAALIMIFALPGNATAQLWGTHGEAQELDTIPTFSIGLEDGMALRKMIESNPSVTMHVAMKIEEKKGMKPEAVFAVLPGMTDENILFTAHPDGFFQGGLDNASGVAVMLGVAEYFASIPKEQRRRTITFMSPVGHHVSHDVSLPWIRDNMKEFIAKTAFVINAEHVAPTQVYHFDKALVRSNAATGHRFYIGGSKAFKDIFFNDFSLFGMGLYEAPQFRPSGDFSPLYQTLPGIEVIESNEFYHTDMDINAVPAVGLEGIARSYAKVIDDANKLSIAEIKASPSN